MFDVIVFEVNFSCALSVMMLGVFVLKHYWKMAFCGIMTSAVHKRVSFSNQRVMIMALVSRCVQGSCYINLAGLVTCRSVRQ